MIGRSSLSSLPFLSDARRGRASSYDTSGGNAEAFAGEIKGFTGVDDPYEVPDDAEIVIDTEQHEPEESARLIVTRLEELGLVGTEVAA